MYTSSITNGIPQAANTQGAAAAQPSELREPETAAQTTNQEAEAAQTTDQDTYTPSTGKEEESTGNYKMDIDTVNQMKAEFEEVKLRFLDTVKKIIGNQISYGQGAWKDISPEDQAAAQEAISEDGYWGVKQTSERIIAFGKALVGGDPSRAEEMRDAFIKGYQAAEKVWGGTLPEISQQTYDAVMKLFDEWAGITGKEEDAGEAEGGSNLPEVPEAPENPEGSAES